jgi:hypothetical protein
LAPRPCLFLRPLNPPPPPPPSSSSSSSKHDTVVRLYDTASDTTRSMWQQRAHGYLHVRRVLFLSFLLLFLFIFILFVCFLSLLFSAAHRVDTLLQLKSTQSNSTVSPNPSRSSAPPSSFAPPLVTSPVVVVYV